MLAVVAFLSMLQVRRMRANSESQWSHPQHAFHKRRCRLNNRKILILYSCKPTTSVQLMRTSSAVFLLVESSVLET